MPSLWTLGVLSLNQALASFGDPAVIFITTLFVVSVLVVPLIWSF
ncbi:hypothetical protein [Pararhizobium sp. O133]